MAIREENVKIKKCFNGLSKIKKAYIGDSKVWSGASIVSYYDGDTLIGTEEVDEGKDVLHPSIDLTKSEYTHIGYTYNGSNVTSLVATGEPMRLDVVYAKTELTIARNESDFANYISGVSSGTAVANWNHNTKNMNFVLNIGSIYNNCVAIINGSRTNSAGSSSISLDGVRLMQFPVGETPKGKTATAEITNGNHTLQAYASISIDGQERLTATLASITLSNPKPWV